MPEKKIVLASASPRRRELLSLTGLDFTIDPGEYDEDMKKDLPPHDLARLLSREKAETVAARYEDALIIAADTFIVYGDEVMGKPSDRDDAKRILKKLSGKTHSVITGFTVLDTASKKKISESVETEVLFKRLSEGEIDSYVKTGEPLDKAGAYAIQGLGSVIVKRIEGDYFNVMGLPLNALAEVLKKFGINIL